MLLKFVFKCFVTNKISKYWMWPEYTYLADLILENKIDCVYFILT